MPRIVTGNILALDCATKLGFAYGMPYEEGPDFGTLELPRTGDNTGLFGLTFKKWFSETLDVQKPSLIIYEQPTHFASIIAAEKIYALIVVAQVVCEERGFQRKKVYPSSLKKFFTGDGRADKDDMIAAAYRRGWKVGDDNQADACALWAFGVHCYGTPEDKARFAPAAPIVRPPKKKKTKANPWPVGGLL